MSTTRIRCHTLGIIMLLILTLTLTGQVGISLAASPLEDLKIPIETVLSLLKDPVYKNPDQRQQQRTISVIPIWIKFRASTRMKRSFF